MPQDFTAAQVLTAAQMDTLSAAVDGYATTATAAGTTTLTFASMFQQFFTGSTTQTVTMPVASTCYVGWKIRVVNNSSGVVTVQSSGANTIYAVPAGGDVIFTCILASGTTAASWDYKDYKVTTTGDWTNYTPTITAEIGTATTITGQAGRYQMINSKTCLVQATWRVASVGTAAGLAIFTLPFTSKNSGFIAVGSARETESSGVIGHVTVTNNIATGKTGKYDNTTFWVNAYTVNVEVIYEVA